MRLLTPTVLTVMMVFALAGCAELKKPAVAKQDVHKHWNSVQARIKYQLAMDSFQARQLEQSHKYLQEAIELDANASAPYVLLAKILLERGEIATARDTLEQATRWGGDDPQIDYLQGVIAERYGRFAEALIWYQRAADRDMMNAHYVAAIGETLVALGRLNDALNLSQERWTDFEQNATLRAMAGGVYMLLGRYEEAADAYHEAVRIAPDDNILKLQYGTALLRANRHEEACAVLTAATSKDNKPPTSALVDLGLCHLELSQPDEAKGVLRRAVENDPQNANAWSVLARAALVLDDLLTARRAGTRAVELKPKHTEHAVLLAYICWRQRDFLAADEVLAKVIEDQPNDPIALFLRSKVYEAMGHPRDVGRGDQKALHLSNRNEWDRFTLALWGSGIKSSGHNQSTLDGRPRAP